MSEHRVLFGRYRLEAVVGRDGLSTVWRSSDEWLGRQVTVTEIALPRDLPPAERQALFEQVARTAKAAARLSHPNIAPTYDVLEGDEGVWIATETIQAPTLQEVLDDEGPLGFQRAAHIGEQLASALEHAHERGVLHRGISPVRVLVTDDDRAVLCGFASAAAETAIRRFQGVPTVATPGYLAPEVVEGWPPAAASDLWSLGATLYAALEGRPPYPTVVAALTGPPPPAPNAGPLAPVLEGLLARAPKARPSLAQTAPTFARAVGRQPTVEGPEATAWAASSSRPGYPVPAPEAAGAPALTGAPPSGHYAIPMNAYQGSTGRFAPVDQAPSRFGVPRGVTALRAAVVLLLLLAVFWGVTTGMGLVPLVLLCAVGLVVAGPGVFAARLGARLLRERSAQRAQARLQADTAFALLSQGRFAEAEPQLRSLLHARAPHGNRVETAANLAVAQLGLGQVSAAERTLNDAVDDGEARSPAVTAALQAALEAVRHTRGDPDARHRLDAILDGAGAAGLPARIRVSLRGDLAAACRDRNRLDEAERHIRAAVADAERELPPSSPSALAARANLAAIRRDLGHTAEALGLYQALLRDARVHLGHRHPHTLAVQASLAAVHHDIGESGVAKALLRDVVRARSLELGHSHPATLRARVNLGYLHLSTGERGTAEQLFEQVLAARDEPAAADAAAVLDEAAEGLAAAREAGR